MTSFHWISLIGPVLGDADHAAVFGLGLLVLQVLNEHLDELPDLRRLFAFAPFVGRHRAFALEADIDHHLAVFDAEDAAFDDLVRLRNPTPPPVSGNRPASSKVAVAAANIDSISGSFSRVRMSARLTIAPYSLCNPLRRFRPVSGSLPWRLLRCAR